MVELSEKTLIENLSQEFVLPKGVMVTTFNCGKANETAS